MRLVKVGLAALLGCLLLAGCGPTSSSPAAPGGAAASQPKAGGSLKLRMDRDPWEWDVASAGTSTPNDYALWLAYNKLLRYKTGPDIRYNDLVLEPDLAERWEVSPDARVYTFHLRKGVKFADMPPVNGREITASDVKFSFEYASRTGEFKDKKLAPSQNAWIFEGLDAVEAPDPATVVVRFKEGFAPFINYAAAKQNPILAREIYDQAGDFKDTLIGGGPFQLDLQASQKGSRWVFKKNPTYWEQGRPYLDEVRFLVIDEDSTARAAFQTKQIDSDYIQNIRELDDLKKAVPDAVFYNYVTPPFRIWLNQARPPLNDVRIRKAVSLSIDRDAFIQTLAGGKGEWALQESDTWNELFTQEEIKSFIKYDPDEARRLVAEAGHPNGVDIDTLYASDQDEAETSLPLLQSQLRKGGINLVFRVMPYAEVSKTRRAREFGLDTSAGASARPDIDSRLMTSVYPNGGNNYQGIDDPKLTELLLAQRREPDQAKRREILRRALRYIGENFISVATFRRTFYEYWHPYVKGYYPHADTSNRGSPGMAGVWIDR